MALKTGTDLNCGDHHGNTYSYLSQAVKEGLVEEKDVDVLLDYEEVVSSRSPSLERRTAVPIRWEVGESIAREDSPIEGQPLPALFGVDDSVTLTHNPKTTERERGRQNPRRQHLFSPSISSQQQETSYTRNRHSHAKRRQSSHATPRSEQAPAWQWRRYWQRDDDGDALEANMSHVPVPRGSSQHAKGWQEAGGTWAGDVSAAAWWNSTTTTASATAPAESVPLRAVKHIRRYPTAEQRHPPGLRSSPHPHGTHSHQKQSRPHMQARPLVPIVTDDSNEHLPDYETFL